MTKVIPKDIHNIIKRYLGNEFKEYYVKQDLIKDIYKITNKYTQIENIPVHYDHNERIHSHEIGRYVDEILRIQKYVINKVTINSEFESIFVYTMSDRGLISITFNKNVMLYLIEISISIKKASYSCNIDINCHIDDSEPRRVRFIIETR